VKAEKAAIVKETQKTAEDLSFGVPLDKHSFGWSGDLLVILDREVAVPRFWCSVKGTAV
jgi:predicted NAD/FAD-binding protein